MIVDKERGDGFPAIEVAVDIIGDLNWEFSEKTGMLDFAPLSISSDGAEFSVLFMDEMIWTSADDMREYKDDNEEEYIPLETHIINECRRITEHLNHFFLETETMEPDYEPEKE